MIKVWILIVLLSGDTRGYNANGPLVIENIASQSECQRVLAHVKDMDDPKNLRWWAGSYRCVEVWKVLK